MSDGSTPTLPRAEVRNAAQPYATTTQIKDFDAKFGDLLRPTSA